MYSYSTFYYFARGDLPSLLGRIYCLAHKRNFINVCGTKLKYIFSAHTLRNFSSHPLCPMHLLLSGFWGFFDLTLVCLYVCMFLVFAGRISISDSQHLSIQYIAEVPTAILCKGRVNTESIHHFACCEKWRHINSTPLVALLPFCTFSPRGLGVRQRYGLHGPDDCTIHRRVFSYWFYIHTYTCTAFVLYVWPKYWCSSYLHFLYSVPSSLYAMYIAKWGGIEKCMRSF